MAEKLFPMIDDQPEGDGHRDEISKESFLDSRQVTAVFHKEGHEAETE